MTDPAERLEVRLVAAHPIRPGLLALEVAARGDPEARSTLWPGLRPPAPPAHPALPRHRAEVRLEGDPAWVEARPLGAPLGDLGLAPEAAAWALADACQALAVLHAAGRTHGDLTPAHVLVAVDGSVVVAGSGVREGHPEGDLAAVLQMVGNLRDAGLSLETLPPDAQALEVLLRDRSGLDEAAARSILAEAARAAVHPVPERAPILRLALATRPGGLLDEVGPTLDPAVEATGTRSEWSEPGDVTRDRQALPSTPETTAAGTSPPEVPRASRVEVLAQVLALPLLVAPDREENTAPSLAGLLAGEPPGAVPLPDEAPPPDPFLARAARPEVSGRPWFAWPWLLLVGFLLLAVLWAAGWLPFP